MTVDELRAPFSAVDSLPVQEAWLGGRGELQSQLARSDLDVGIVVLPIPSAIFYPEVVEGQWLSAPSSTGAAEVVLNQQGWASYGAPAVGTKVTVQQGALTVDAVLAGVIRQFDRPKLFLSQSTWERVTGKPMLANTLRLSGPAPEGGRDSPAELALKVDVEDALAASSLRVSQVLTRLERWHILLEHLDVILRCC